MYPQVFNLFYSLRIQS